MQKVKHSLYFLLSFALIFSGCSSSSDDITAELPVNEESNPDSIDDEIPENPEESEESEEKELTLFFVNDQHGQINNFAKIKHIVDAKKLENPNVILACSGDIFSGNAVVDAFTEKGFPMIDLMNKTGFDIAVLGNHEYDYGETVLADRINQSEFAWICANVDMLSTNIPEPKEYQSIEINDIKVTFLGLVETNGKEDDIIPSTHPAKVENISFERPENVVEKYADVKETEDADLYVALTHLGIDGGSSYLGDVQLAEQFPYFDLIIGGHSHSLINTIVNDIPVFQAGGNLNYLAQIDLVVKDKEIIEINPILHDLNTEENYDSTLQSIIDEYNDYPFLKEVIGYARSPLDERNKVGCMYTDVLKKYGNVDITIQNNGAVRDLLDEGEITVEEIFSIDPFGNGFVILDISVADLKSFFQFSGEQNIHYSGVEINNLNGQLTISLNGTILNDDEILTLGVNDYILSVYDSYFENDGELQPLTTAESIIEYLKNSTEDIEYSDCDNSFN